MAKKNNFLEKTDISGLFIIERPTFKDKRGFFREILRMSDLKENRIDFKPKQLNHSYSEPNVIRGLHAENWNKIVYPVTGEVFSAVVDIRPKSTTFSKVETFVFDRNGYKALFISKGLANSICVTGDASAHYFYLVDEYYDGSDAKAVAWDDPDLDIDWPVKKPIISERDKSSPTLRELFP